MIHAAVSVNFGIIACLASGRRDRSVLKVQRIPLEDPFRIYQKYVCLYPRSSWKDYPAQKHSGRTTGLIVNHRTISANSDCIHANCLCHPDCMNIFLSFKIYTFILHQSMTRFFLFVSGYNFLLNFKDKYMFGSLVITFLI